MLCERCVRSSSCRKLSFRSLPRDVMCQKAPSNSNLSGVDMPPRILGVNKNRQNSTESTEDVSIPRRYWAISIHRVEWRFDPPKTEA